MTETTRLRRLKKYRNDGSHGAVVHGAVVPPLITSYAAVYREKPYSYKNIAPVESAGGQGTAAPTSFTHHNLLPTVWKHDR